MPNKLDLPEIQSMVLQEVVEAKVKSAWNELQVPLLVEDVSFSLDAMKGFPGPFVKFWQEKAGYDLAVKIADELGNNRVTVSCGVAYFDGNEVLYTEGSVQGKIVAKREGEGFPGGFDFYFVPDGSNLAFSEMGLEAKNAISHRFRGWSEMKHLLIEKGIIDAD